MPPFKNFVVAFTTITCTLANPISNVASKVRRDPPPVPSSYPLGAAFPNEWQYLNFESTDDTDKKHLGQLHDDVMKFDLGELLAGTPDAAAKANKIYLRYFAKSDEEDDFQKTIASVYNILGNNGGPSELVKTFIIDNKDFNAGKKNKVQCGPDDLAYTDTDDLDQREKIHFCDKAYDLPSILSPKCQDFDKFPSTKMDTFSRIALHEMTHYSSVGIPSLVKRNIVDTTNEDGHRAYDPERVHGLVDPEQDDNPVAAEANADSYAWMALDIYMSFACSTDPGNSENYFTESPPAYEHLPPPA